jgi:gliding motility-associated-like protein
MQRSLPVRLILFLLISLFLSSHQKVSAQSENNVWCFGNGKGLDFNSSPPVSTTTNMHVNEGSSSISDQAGNLLFYTAGFCIWDRNGNPMPNGASLFGNGPVYNGVPKGSSAGGAAIIKSVTDENIYYCFSLGAYEDGPISLWYSVVDMTLNNGLGDVVAGQKNILLDSGLSEFIAVAKGEECKSYWLIVNPPANALPPFNGQIRAFKIDATGVHTTPVTTNTSFAGWVNFSNGGDYVVMSRSYSFELFQFDKATGVAFNPFLINQTNVGANVCWFSPDDSRLYLAGHGLGIAQYDFSLYPNTTAFANSETIIVSGSNILTDLNLGSRVGPDGKIYLINAISQTDYLGVIANPNALGLACNYSRTGYALPYDTGDTTFSSLGNRVVINPPRDTVFHTMVQVHGCFDTTILLTSQAQGRHLWSTSDTAANIHVTQSGNYYKISSLNCQATIDSFRVDITDFNVDLGNDTGLCPDHTMVLNAMVPGASYHWQDGSTSDQYLVGNAGNYYVVVSKDGCSLSDTIAVSAVHPYVDIAEPDTAICNGTQMTLHAEAFPDGTLLWNTGSDQPSVVTDTNTLYKVTLENVCGTFTDSVSVRLLDCNCRFYTPNSFSPNGDGLNDVFEVRNFCLLLKDYSFSIFNRYGQRVFQTQKPEVSWDGIYAGKPSDVGVYYYIMRYKTNDGTEGKKKGDLTLLR